MIFSRFRILVLAIAWVLTVGIPTVANASGTAGQDVLRIGILPFASTLALLKTHQPLRQYLEDTLGRPVETFTASDFVAFHRSTLAGDYDVVITGPHFGAAAIDAGFVPLVRYRLTLRPILVVRRGTGIASTEQLRGRTVAVSNRLSISTVAGQRWLANAGLDAGRDYGVLESPTHTTAITAVTIGEADAALTTLTPLRQMSEEIRGKVDIIESPITVPHLFTLAHPRMTADDVAQLKRALHDFSEAAPEGRAFFNQTGYQGYATLTLEDIEAMRPYLEQTRDLLQSPRAGQ